MTTVKSPVGDGAVVAEAAIVVSHPGQAQQRLPARVGRQGPRVDRQSRHIAQRADHPADPVELLCSAFDARVFAAASHGVVTHPARPGVCIANSPQDTRPLRVEITTEIHGLLNFIKLISASGHWPVLALLHNYITEAYLLTYFVVPENAGFNCSSSCICSS